jgi:hypothetical protein
MEFALVLPLLLVVVLGTVEVSYALLDQHIVTRLTREGSNLISRDVTLEDAVTALNTMTQPPVDFGTRSRVIFSVLKRGATTGTNNFDRVILYQRREYGSLSASSKIATQGSASFNGPPNYEASNSDNNTNLRVTNLPADLITVPGGMVYVTEVYSTHTLLTPVNRFGVDVPTVFYSIAYF